jgi:hypothetical protein
MWKWEFCCFDVWFLVCLYWRGFCYLCFYWIGIVVFGFIGYCLCARWEYSFSCTFSRHGIAKPSFSFLIWLVEKAVFISDAGRSLRPAAQCGKDVSVCDCVKTKKVVENNDFQRLS